MAWLLLPGGLWVPAAEVPTGDLQVRLIDAATREPVAATVVLLDATGKPVEPAAGLREGFRVAGAFRRAVPAGVTRLRVSRGPEYVAQEREVRVPEGAVVELGMELERRVDLRRRGWFAGDHHAHMLHGERAVGVGFDDIALAARSEDLQVLSVAQAWALENATPERLEAEFASRSQDGCLLTWNLEAPKNYYLGDAGRCLGHCWTLGMRGRTPEGGDVIARLLEASAWDYESEKAPVANFESQALVRAQGGSVFYTHVARWWTGAWGGAGGYPRRAAMRVSNMAVELPFDVLAGPTFDGLDVITGTGEFAADEKAFRLWSLLLDHGYRVAATASSDACFDRPGGATPGAARLYAHLDGGFSLEAFRRAVAAGRTVATTGPLLVATLDGQPPGTVRPADGSRHALRLEAWASGVVTGGLAHVEVLRNGGVLRRFDLTNGPTHFEAQVELGGGEDGGPGWYVVRVFGTDPRRQRAVSGAFFLDREPWRAPEPVPASLEIRVVDARTGEPLDAVLKEVPFLGARPAAIGTPVVHRLRGGAGRVQVPATVRVRAEAEGYVSRTLSPFFDQPALVDLITGMDDAALLDWGTFERVKSLLGDGRLTFRLVPATGASSEARGPGSPGWRKAGPGGRVRPGDETCDPDSSARAAAHPVPRRTVASTAL